MKTNAKVLYWNARCYIVLMAWNDLWILMTVRYVDAMILARITPVLMKHDVLLTCIAIHKRGRQSSEESADQVS
jgi:hypothetical protein